MTDTITFAQLRACLRALGDIAEAPPKSPAELLDRCRDAAIVQGAEFFDDMPDLVEEMHTTFRRLLAVHR